MLFAMKKFTADIGQVVRILLVLRGLGGACLAVALQAYPSEHSQRGEFLSVNATLIDHPPDANYERETRLHGSIPFSVELVIATVWVLMVISMPLATLWHDGMAIAKTQVASILVMLFSFLGGIWLFTNLLFFQSSHFDGIRSLTLVECVYFMAQVLTTVGYGDITPAKPRAQVFVALYVLFSLLLIANTVSDVANALADRMWEAHDENVESGLRRLTSSGTEEGLPSGRSGTLEEDTLAFSSLLAHQVPQLPWKSLSRKLAGWLFFVSLGIFFYTNYPGEEKTIWQSTYFSIITLSTVGFGAFTALTPGGKAFGAFWMLFGSFSLLGLVGAFTEMMCAIKSREKWRNQKENVHEDEVYKALPDRLNLKEFVEFALEYTSLANRQDLENIQSTFEEICPASGEAKVTRKQAMALLENDALGSSWDALLTPEWVSCQLAPVA
eukprot:CAMPEP_0172811070 /NCGR_PEP_ID=MMETSP1075-20121228/9190_1 /TAXON_ID=2916 /ORGANISM="Ceratium fusus, Strain PA161109" /LENGTH=440 /DNA_ID=CAMNT_0013650457 /DNA_START=68 /DNA_END=1387 /DNA_ORIENTATION=-